MSMPCPTSLWESDLTPKAAFIFRAQSVTDPKTLQGITEKEQPCGTGHLSSDLKKQQNERLVP